MINAQIYFRKRRRMLERITDFRILFGVLTLVYCLMVVVFSIALGRTQIIDPKITLTPFPAEYVPDPQKTVGVSFSINNFTKFEIIKNEFISNVTVCFTYDKSFINPDLIDKFTIENAVVINKSTPSHDTAPNGKAITCYDMQLKSTNIFDYRYFPFDRHRINFIIINKGVAPNQFIYVTNDQSLFVQTQTFTQDWTHYGQSTAYGLDTFDVNVMGKTSQIAYERVVFSIDVERAIPKAAFIIFLPLFLIFFIGLLSLTFDVLTQFGTILTLSLGSTTALIFYSNQLRGLLPATGTFTSVEMVYVLVLAIILLTLTLQIIMLQYLHKKQSTTQIKEVLDYTAMSLNIIRSLFFLFFPIIMLVMVSLVLLF